MIYFNEFIKESISHSVPKSLIKEIMHDIVDCKDEIFENPKYADLILTEATNKYDIYFKFSNKKNLKNNPVRGAALRTDLSIVIYIDTEIISKEWEKFLIEVEPTIVHEYTHKIEFELNKKSYDTDENFVKDLIKKYSNYSDDLDDYYSNRIEVVAYANEAMYAFKHLYKLSNQELKQLLENPTTVDCKYDGCNIWNRYITKYKGSETFEWFLKACYEYLDETQKNLI